MSWTIKGESGKALDETVRSLDSLGEIGARLTLASLDSDLFEATIATEDAAATGALIPDEGQQVELFHDSVRRFKGNITIPRVQIRQISITAEGPWWWMQRIQLTQDQDDAEGTTDARPSFVFPTQDLKTSITDLINRAITDGVPITLGTIDDMFTFPRITLSQMSYAQALAELMRIVPDAVAWFDYTGTGNPSLNVSRRGNMSTTTIALGTDNVEELDVWPRLDLEVKQVEVVGVERDSTTGDATWNSQASGTPTTGKNQIVVISGPEVNDFLPEEKDSQIELKTFAMPTGGTALSSLTESSTHSATDAGADILAFVKDREPIIAGFIREFGSDFGDYLIVSNGGRFNVSNFTSGSLNGAPRQDLDKPNLVSTESTSGLYVVSNQEQVPDWLADENGLTVVRASLTGWLRYTRYPEEDAPDFWQWIGDRAVRQMTGYLPNVSGQTSGEFQRNTFFEFSIPAILVSQAYATLTTVYRQWAFDYIQPPAGLAGNLQGAQDWIPHEGRIRTVADEVDGSPDLNKGINISNGRASLATMKALPKSIVYEIQRGRKTTNLGPPARADFGTLANRFKRHPKDNITYL